jgi:hypothetical protein
LAVGAEHAASDASHLHAVLHLGDGDLVVLSEDLKICAHAAHRGGVHASAPDQ